MFRCGFGGGRVADIWCVTGVFAGAGGGSGRCAVEELFCLGVGAGIAALHGARERIEDGRLLRYGRLFSPSGHVVSSRSITSIIARAFKKACIC